MGEVLIPIVGQSSDKRNRIAYPWTFNTKSLRTRQITYWLACRMRKRYDCTWHIAVEHCRPWGRRCTGSRSTCMLRHESWCQILSIHCPGIATGPGWKLLWGSWWVAWLPIELRVCRGKFGNLWQRDRQATRASSNVLCRRKSWSQWSSRRSASYRTGSK